MRENVMAPHLKPPDSLPEPKEPRYHPAYGMHLYMTKKPWNVVAACIERFTDVGEIVLDPFIGCGVTAGEALRLRRKVIAFDLCPLSVFITRMSITPYEPGELTSFLNMFEEIKLKASKEITPAYETICSDCGSDAIVIEASYDSQNVAEDPRERLWALTELNRSVCAILITPVGESLELKTY